MTQFEGRVAGLHPRTMPKIRHIQVRNVFNFLEIAGHNEETSSASHFLFVRCGF